MSSQNVWPWSKHSKVSVRLVLQKKWKVKELPITFLPTSLELSSSFTQFLNIFSFLLLKLWRSLQVCCLAPGCCDPSIQRQHVTTWTWFNVSFQNAQQSNLWFTHTDDFLTCLQSISPVLILIKTSLEPQGRGYETPYPDLQTRCQTSPMETAKLWAEKRRYCPENECTTC